MEMGISVPMDCDKSITLSADLKFFRRFNVTSIMIK